MMKHVIPALSIVLVILARADHLTGFENPKLYGEPIKEAKTISLAEALKDPARFANETVILEGVTGSVCQTKGCWMYLEDGSERVRVTFKDYAFFVPMDSQGKKARAQGVLTSKLVKKEVLEHWAAEGGEADKEEITGDMTVVILTASGVEIEGGSPLSPEQESFMSKEK